MDGLLRMKMLLERMLHGVAFSLLLFPNGFEKVYYCKSGAKLTSIREIKSDQDIVDLLKVGYDNEFQIDMYVDHFGYDIMEMVEFDRNKELRKTRIKAELDSSDDDYHYSDDHLKEIENVDFHTEGDDSVVIKNITTQDPFLTKLCSARILFRGNVEYGVNEETPQVDPDDNQIDPVYKVKNGLVYPAFDPDIPWDKMELILGMRFETPQQLKMALANYGVAHGYQLWYMKNDWRQVLVYCGRNVVEGKCAGKKGNKHRVLPKKVRTSLFRGDEGNQASKKPVKKSVKKHVKRHVKKPVNKKPDSQSGEGTSQSPKWTKKQIQNSKKVNCPFRLYALWMSREQLVQIKSLRSEHKCCRNHNLGSLVTYKWIAMQYFKEIIEDPFMPLRKMRDDIKQKFMIDVSVGQCKRAKQLALFDHEVESDNGSVSFKRMYICFKGVKDGWLAGCRKRLSTENVQDIYMQISRKSIVGCNIRDYFGLQLLEHQFLQIMDQIKLLDVNAYDYLIQRNPNTWSRAFFEMDMRCAAFENGISESFNRAILGPRMKPIITMLEEIRLYIMQRIVVMNKLAFSLEDTITPSIKKRLEILKEKQREWIVFLSRFQELEVRKGDQSYGVSLQHKVCQCRMWELSGIPCVHVVTVYMHVGSDLDAGISYWYSRESWFNAYQFSIKQVFGTNMWKRTNDVPPLPPIIRKMPDRPQKNRIKAPGETGGSQGGGRSGRGDGNNGSVVEGGGGRAGGKGKRGGERAGRGGVFPSSSSCCILIAEEEYQLELDEQAFRECMEEQAITLAKIDAEQEKMDKERREEQEWEEKNDYFNPANWQEESMEEAPMNQQYHEVFIPSIHFQPTQQSGVWVVDTTVSVADEAPKQETSDDGPAPEQGKSPDVDKGKAKASVEDGPAPKKKRGRPPSSVDGFRIYHKNRGRSERISNMKLNKPFQFDKFGTEVDIITQRQNKPKQHEQKMRHGMKDCAKSRPKVPKCQSVESILMNQAVKPETEPEEYLMDAILTHLKCGKAQLGIFMETDEDQMGPQSLHSLHLCYEDCEDQMGPQSITTAHLCAIDKDCEDFEGPILAQLQPISAIVHTKPTS
ncbi:calcium/proton exchanger [Tanacetum coccineum]